MSIVDRRNHQAVQPILERHAVVNGNIYYLLDPAAQWLRSAHPLAATLLRRLMIENTLDGANANGIGMPPA